MIFLVFLITTMFASSFKTQYKFSGNQINAIRSAFQLLPSSSPMSEFSPRNYHSHSHRMGRTSPLFGKKGDRATEGSNFRGREDYYPKSNNQQKYVNALHNPQNSVVVCYGPAGTGKTMFACNVAVNELEKGNVKKIVLTRPVVSVDEELGYLPGNIVSKMDPWTRPIMDIFMEFYSKSEIESMIQDGIIEISPLAFMRGRTFKKAFIIADEMQNSSPNQMLMLITRIGSHSKMVITGDLRQSDRCENNGLLDLARRLHRHKPFGVDYVELGSDDVFRSPVVANIIKLYETDFGERGNIPETAAGNVCFPPLFPPPSHRATTNVNTQGKIHYGVDIETEIDDICGGGENVVEMEIEIEELEKNSELEVAADMMVDEDAFVDKYLASPSSNHSNSSVSFGVKIGDVETASSVEGDNTSKNIKRELDNLTEDIVIIYKEGHNDSALIPKSHITRNIIRFFNSSDGNTK